MFGTWRWNVTLGICGVVLTLIFSLASNGLEVTLFRCLYAFIVFFLITYGFRALTAMIVKPSVSLPAIHNGSDESMGNVINLATPDETDELNAMLKMQLDGSPKSEKIDPADFQPLSPPKLVSTQNKEPEELAKALRHLTGE